MVKCSRYVTCISHGLPWLISFIVNQVMVIRMVLIRFHAASGSTALVHSRGINFREVGLFSWAECASLLIVSFDAPRVPDEDPLPTVGTFETIVALIAAFVYHTGESASTTSAAHMPSTYLA